MTTPYRVFCRTCGNSELSREEYDSQMNQPDSLWKCPSCRSTADWDDEWYETAQDLMNCASMRRAKDQMLPASVSQCVGSEPKVFYLSDASEHECCKTCPLLEIDFSGTGEDFKRLEDWAKEQVNA